MNGFQVIRRDHWMKEAAYKNITKIKPTIPIDLRSTLKKYRGIEGLPWPIESGISPLKLVDGLAPVTEYENVIKYFETALTKDFCDFIFCSTSDADFSLPKNFRQLGFDYGLYPSEDGNFSCIFHEVLFGHFDVLKSYAKHLNDYLLFPSEEICSAFRKERDYLKSTGEDLESSVINEDFMPIKISAVP